MRCMLVTGKGGGHVHGFAPLLNVLPCLVPERSTDYPGEQSRLISVRPVSLLVTLKPVRAACVA